MAVSVKRVFLYSSLRLISYKKVDLETLLITCKNPRFFLPGDNGKVLDQPILYLCVKFPPSFSTFTLSINQKQRKKPHAMNYTNQSAD